jgi:uncharacterized SAM-binding protein YcdF (DUF218 family)
VTLAPPSRSLRVLGAVTAAGFLVAAFSPLANVLHRRARITAAPEPAEAIVVLGAGVGPDGILDQVSLRRLLRGIVLYRQGLAPRLVLLGARNLAGVVEAEVRARLAGELAVPASALSLESRAHTTAEEAALSARLLQPQGVRRVLLVTGHYHMPRARRLFEAAGFEVVPAATDELSGEDLRPEGRLRILRVLATERLAGVYNRLTGRL